MNTILRPIEILLVEDNPGDVRLTQEALKQEHLNINLNIVRDGEEAIKFLTKIDSYINAVTPDLILLDLNLPRKDGRELLKDIKEDQNLKHIPVVVLTISNAEDDILRCYKLHANCYITKPINLSDFIEVIKGIEHFWFRIVTLPSK